MDSRDYGFGARGQDEGEEDLMNILLIKEDEINEDERSVENDGMFEATKQKRDEGSGRKSYDDVSHMDAVLTFPKDVLEKSACRKVPFSKSLSFAGDGTYHTTGSSDFEDSIYEMASPLVVSAVDLGFMGGGMGTFSHLSSSKMKSDDTHSHSSAAVWSLTQSSPMLASYSLQAGHNSMRSAPTQTQSTSKTPSTSNIKSASFSKFKKHKSITLPVSSTATSSNANFAGTFFDWSPTYRSPAMLPSISDTALADGSSSMDTPDSGFCTPNQDGLFDVARTTPGHFLGASASSDYDGTPSEFDGFLPDNIVTTPKARPLPLRRFRLENNMDAAQNADTASQDIFSCEEERMQTGEDSQFSDCASSAQGGLPDDCVEMEDLGLPSSLALSFAQSQSTERIRMFLFIK
ncbi:uncharacterized protein LOC101858362 [Aplysia californica]|uniref:Uncharacterized protein LOC101858362 n=1 Tax=Aplysia californica TaxID=6500 RepID=A0ABM1AA98_APLCA|nr:uncharacterized protein LOC101858362 [Aplysia californica]